MPAQIEALLASEWAADVRARGGAVYAIGPSARILHADPALLEFVGRKSLPRNGYDMSDPEDAASGGDLIAQGMQGPYLVRWAFLDDDRQRRWVRMEGHPTPPRGYLVMGVWPEDDPNHHAISIEPLPQSG